MTKVTTAIGSRNVGTDLLAKLRPSEQVGISYKVVDPESDTLRRVHQHGVETRVGGVNWLLACPDLPDLAFEATFVRTMCHEADASAVAESITSRVAEVAHYVPGHKPRVPQSGCPSKEWGGLFRVAVFLQVRCSDYLRPWAGNPDIMTAVAARVGEFLDITRTVAVPA